ncbi:MAG: alpha/beta fold hydrolase [Cytophagaceae bacterium]
MEILNHKILGEGDPLIYIHGLFGSSDNLLSVAKTLSKDFTIILPDARNHGTSFHSEEFNYSAMAEDIFYLAQHLSLKEFFLMGHSMGGKIAMEYANKYPNDIKKLIVVDISPRYYRPHHQSFLEGLNSINLENLTSRNQADEILSHYVEDVHIRQFLLKNLYRKDDNSFAWRINLNTITNKIENIGEPLKYFKPIEIPTLFIKGTTSGYIQEKDEVLINEIFINNKIEKIEGAGHWVHAEKPFEFCKTVRNFLLSN